MDELFSEQDVGSIFTLSPVFIDFLAHWLESGPCGAADWFDQVSEGPSKAWHNMVGRAEAVLQRLALDERALQIIEKSHGWFKALLLGETQELDSLHERFHFVPIVGIPRTGGSYLTAELFAALGYSKEAVHTAIAHDGFPDAGPFRLRRGNNSWVSTLANVAQYITAVELFFAPGRAGAAVVPKKVTKAIYAPGLFRAVFGAAAEYVVTVRHPVASCISTYEKSGGLPPGEVFKVRSILERWIQRDNFLLGVRRSELADMEYFEAYIRYWEQFHVRLAMSGLLTNRRCIVVPYSKERMEDLASRWHRRFESGRGAAAFVTNENLLARHPGWAARSEAALRRVESVWNRFGARFPLAEVSNCI